VQVSVSLFMFWSTYTSYSSSFYISQSQWSYGLAYLSSFRKVEI